MKTLVAAAVLLAGGLPPSGMADAPSHTGVKILMTKALEDLAGKEGQMLVVTYPPGGTDEVHRHDAHVFVYVLEGSIVMQLAGSPPVSLQAGDSFYEGPSDVHVIGRNASATKTARFVVTLIKNKGAPVLTPVK